MVTIKQEMRKSMTQILKTSIIPIEYDEKTKASAFELKDILEQNPLFFKTVLKKYQQISYLKKQHSFYLQTNNTINILEKMYNGNINNCNKKDWLDKEAGRALLLYTINRKIKGQYDFSEFEEDTINQFLVYGYIHETKAYEKIDSYLENMTKNQQQEIEEWLYNKYSFELLNYLIKVQYQKIVQRLLLGKEENIEETLNTMIRITATKEFLREGQEKECNLSLSSKEIDQLCEEFLIKIEPSLNWYKIFCMAKQAGVFIEDSNDKKIIENEIGIDEWTCFQHTDGNWYIYSPSTGTILDSIYKIHEFIHYLINTTPPILEENIYILKELPSLFFEELMRMFLIEKGYPKEEIEKDKFNRELGISKMSSALLDILFYIEQISHGEKITLEQELMRQKEIKKIYEELEPDKKISLNFLKENVLKTTKNSIEELIEDPLFVEETYPYIIGYQYSEILLERAKQDKSIITNMINMIPGIKTLTTNEVINRLGLTSLRKKSGNQYKIKKC